MVFLLYARRLRVAEPGGGATGSCTVGVAKGELRLQDFCLFSETIRQHSIT